MFIWYNPDDINVHIWQGFSNRPKNPEIFWDISDVDYHPHIQPNKVRTKTEENQGIKNESDQVAIRKGD